MFIPSYIITANFYLSYEQNAADHTGYHTLNIRVFRLSFQKLESLKKP